MSSDFNNNIGFRFKKSSSCAYQKISMFRHKPRFTSTVQKTRYPAVKNSWSNNQYNVIKTSLEYFNIRTFGRKYQASFYNVLVLNKLYEICVTHGHDFWKNTHPAVRNSFHFSTKMSIWTSPEQIKSKTLFRIASHFWTNLYLSPEMSVKYCILLTGHLLVVQIRVFLCGLPNLKNISFEKDDGRKESTPLSWLTPCSSMKVARWWKTI